MCCEPWLLFYEMAQSTSSSRRAGTERARGIGGLIVRYWGGCDVKASQERGRLLGDVHRGGSVRDCDGRVFPVGLRNRGGRGGSRGVPYGAQGGERPGLDVIHK